MDLLERLKIGPLLCDGDKRPMLMKLGLSPDAPAELWNIEHTDEVEDIHRAYRDAGCDVVTTNTTAGAKPALERHHLAEQEAELNELAVRLARRAVGGSCHLMGHIGPRNGFDGPGGELDDEKIYRIYRGHVMSLKRGGADGICIEGIGTINEMRTAVRAAKGVSYWPVLALQRFISDADGNWLTLDGGSIDLAVKTVIDADVDMIGAGGFSARRPEDVIALVAALKQVSRRFPVMIRIPAILEDGTPQTPEQLASLVKPLLSAGVQIIGGGTGTTPEHLAAMAAAMP